MDQLAPPARLEMMVHQGHKARPDRRVPTATRARREIGVNAARVESPVKLDRQDLAANAARPARAVRWDRVERKDTVVGWARLAHLVLVGPRGRRDIRVKMAAMDQQEEVMTATAKGILMSTVTGTVTTTWTTMGTTQGTTQGTTSTTMVATRITLNQGMTMEGTQKAGTQTGTRTFPNEAGGERVASAGRRARRYPARHSSQFHFGIS